MAVSDALDSESDYGYNFSPKEELQLIQIAAEASATLSCGPSARETSRTAATDLLSGQAAGQDDDRKTLASRQRAPHEFSLSRDRVEAAALPDQAAAHPVSGGADIVYPDCA